MALLITNIGNAGLFNPVTGAFIAAFSKMESIALDVDSKLTETYGGSGSYSIINISADRKPKVSVKGPEVPLGAAAPLLGASQTVAATGSPVQIPIIDEATISAGGTLTLLNGNVISATVTSVSIIGALDGKVYTGVASAPTTGQFANPTAGASSITCNTADAGKPVFIMYTIDSTTGGAINIASNSMPGIYRFVANAKVVNSEDPNKAFVPITFDVAQTQFIGTWTMSQERQKASATSLDLSILDPGGSNPAIKILTAAKFAG